MILAIKKHKTTKAIIRIIKDNGGDLKWTKDWIVFGINYHDLGRFYHMYKEKFERYCERTYDTWLALNLCEQMGSDIEWLKKLIEDNPGYQNNIGWILDRYYYFEILSDKKEMIKWAEDLAEKRGWSNLAYRLWAEHGSDKNWAKQIFIKTKDEESLEGLKRYHPELFKV